MDREQRESLDRLIFWLADEAKKRYGAGRTHDLHLWDWEVTALLNALRGAPRIKPDYSWGSVGSPTMSDLEH